MPFDAPPLLGALAVRTIRETEFVDLTERLEAFVADAGLSRGALHVVTRHTTTGLLINEAEPLLLEDLAQLFERLAPRTAAYGHDDFPRRGPNLLPGERRNGFAHCRAALLRTSETVLVQGGRLCLGRWQRVLLAEFDGPQLREVGVVVVPGG